MRRRYDKITFELAAWNPHALKEMALGYVTASRGACHMNGFSIAEHNHNTLMDCLGICVFALDGFGKDGLRRLLSVITGIDWSEEEYAKVGERVFNLERAINCREGFARAEFEKMMTDYYLARGWDEKTGIPTPAKLKSLGLEFIA